ncbi:unnamed protein product, partial [Urochloa humidicola]
MAAPLRIFCREDINLNVAVRGSGTTVVLARADPDDVLQHWVQDFSASGIVTDDEGQRAFALVNKATGQALVNKNIISPSDKQVHVYIALEKRLHQALLSPCSRRGSRHAQSRASSLQVQLAPYLSDVRVDLSMLWTLGGKDLGGGFREVRVLTAEGHHPDPQRPLGQRQGRHRRRSPPFPPGRPQRRLEARPRLRVMVSICTWKWNQSFSPPSVVDLLSALPPPLPFCNGILLCSAR